MRNFSYAFRSLFRQNGTIGDDFLRAAAMGDEGSVLLVGDTSGNWTGVNAGSFDFAAIKLDASGKELWRWQVGVVANIVRY